MMNINWKLRANPATIAGIATGIAGLIFTLASQYGYQLPFEQNDLIVFITTCITILAFVINQIGVLTDPTTAGLSDSDRALKYDEPHDDSATPVSDFKQSDIEKFFNTTQEMYESKTPVNLMKVWGRSIYWGTVRPSRANEGDIWMDESDHHRVYKWQNERWIKTESFGIVNEVS